MHSPPRGAVVHLLNFSAQWLELRTEQLRPPELPRMSPSLTHQRQRPSSMHRPLRYGRAEYTNKPKTHDTHPNKFKYLIPLCNRKKLLKNRAEFWLATLRLEARAPGNPGIGWG